MDLLLGGIPPAGAVGLPVCFLSRTERISVSLDASGRAQTLGALGRSQDVLIDGGDEELTVADERLRPSLIDPAEELGLAGGNV